MNKGEKMTREDERKLYEAYNTLDKLLNSPKQELETQEVQDIVESLKELAITIFRQTIEKPSIYNKAVQIFENECEKILAKYKKT